RIASRPESPPSLNVSTFAFRLLAGGAHIHVDFHAAGHFNDLRCFPGHFGSPLQRGRLPPSPLNYSVTKSSPVNSFGMKPARILLRCSRASGCGRAGRPNQWAINGVFFSPEGNKVPKRCRWSHVSDKELVRMARLPIRPRRPHWSRMPRYFFNTRIGDELIDAPEGEELRNPDRAWEVARAMILELIKSKGAGGVLLNAVIEVTDDDGEIVLEFPFSEALLDLPDSQQTRH